MMFQSYRTNRAGTVRFLWLVAALSWIGVGCGSLPDDESGSIFEVMAINAYYEDSSTFTNQVDVVQVNCETDPEKPPKWEWYSDHYVSVDFLNRHLPNRNTSLGTVGREVDQYTASVVYLKSYEIHYIPLTAVTSRYPVPSPLVVPVTQTVAVPPCSPGLPGQTCPPTTMIMGYLVPVATKEVLRAHFIDAGEQLSYDVHYTFYGVNDFGIPVTAKAQLNFYAANYDHCD